MRPTPATLTTRTARVFAVVAVALGLVTATLITANAAPQATSAPDESAVLSATVESSATAVPSDGDFGYTVHIRLSEPASYLQTRIRIRRTSGKLVFQRTKVENSQLAGEHDASFGRSLEGLSLPPGSYPVQIEVRADVNGSTVTTDIATSLLVFDPAEKPAGVVILARINGQSLEAPDGRFAVDPAVATRARDNVNAIASAILADPAARLTLSVPPMLLAQWKRTADGYTMSDGREVSASDPTPLSYAAALDLLGAAVRTGRLELLSTGLADPDLAQLAAQGLGRDAAPHYEEGRSASFASLETSPSTGTAPAGACIPSAIVYALKPLGIGYIVEDSDCARSGDNTVTSGTYAIASSSLRALLSDVTASKTLASGDMTATLSRVASRQIGSPTQPVVARVELTDSGLNASATVVPALQALEREPWAKLALGRDTVVPKGARTVRLLSDKIGATAPPGFWATVSRARIYADALMASLGPADSDASSAQTNSLIAESSAWSGPDDSWADASRGRQFATASLKTSRGILDTVGIEIESITLPSAHGEVPVSLQNGTNKTLNVTVRTSTSGGIEVQGPDIIDTVMRPQETFVQIPVNMHSTLSGKLTVEVLAGTVVLSERTVDVRASYLDRLVIIGGIVLALGVMLAFIVRRVRAAERAELAAASVDDGDQRYTGTPRTKEDDEDR